MRNILNWIVQGFGALLMIALFFGVVYLGLGWYTNNGQNIKLPNLLGQQTNTAISKLEELNLRYEIIDSTYSPDLPKNSIAKMDPIPGTNVKENRIVFITINGLEEPKSTMPQLVDRSFTLANALLKSRGLQLGTVMYVYDSIGHNLVLSQKFMGLDIRTGTKIKRGSVIDLVLTTNREGLVSSKDSFGRIMEKDSNQNLLTAEAKKILLQEQIEKNQAKKSKNPIKEKPEGVLNKD